ncbi:MAG: DUF4337 domain-containing protein [Candidatus Eremiobacteraeota bacterium]|nr:DUF4337 domain-containing protein [Candidatus Eremiobacteraeota bacterium]
MPENYNPTEGLEHAAHAHELLERSESTLLRFVPLMAAVLAIFAGLSSLYAGRLGERALHLKNEAVLDEVKAADLWTEYEAESIKAHVYTAAGVSANPASSAKLRTTIAKYRHQQGPLRDEALKLERERDIALARSDETEARKGVFDIALALFEVSIVLTSIAAMVKRPFLFFMAAAGGIIGLVFCLRGIFSGPL